MSVSGNRLVAGRAGARTSLPGTPEGLRHCDRESVRQENWRPFVLLSVAASLDGYIGNGPSDRLLLPNDEDLDRVDEVRASVDAILVGPGTIRADDPRLLVKSGTRRAMRIAQGRAESPVKVTISSGGELDPAARFFSAGAGTKLVYATSPARPALADRLGSVATVVDAGEPLDLDIVLADLAERGIDRLMVEGGGTMHTLFLTAGVVDELHVAISPFLVGDAGASRPLETGRFAPGPDCRMSLSDVRKVGDVVLLVYRPGATRS